MVLPRTNCSEKNIVQHYDENIYAPHTEKFSGPRDTIAAGDTKLKITRRLDDIMGPTADQIRAATDVFLCVAVAVVRISQVSSLVYMRAWLSEMGLLHPLMVDAVDRRNEWTDVEMY